LRDYFQACGAWDKEEIGAWSDIELSAMVWQEAASNMRDFEDRCDSSWDTYQAKAEQGQISGNLYADREGRIFALFSH
jgi:hypothetical protein